MTQPRISRRTMLASVGIGAAGVAGLAVAWQSGAIGTPGASGTSAAGTTSDGYLSSNTVHDVSLTFDATEYATMLQGYRSTGDKAWLKATVTIDGTAHANAGIRLKGNSSLKGVSADATAQSLPWLVRLDKYTKGENHQGMTSFIIRASSSTSALNEAVALDLLAASGLASERAAYIALRANDSDAVLRLTVENLDDAWTKRQFNTAGLLYKAEADGDYSYRGTDPASYDNVFDQETGDDNLTPLIEFLNFINTSSDADFAAKLATHLDVDKFTTYLALQALIDNFDDIDGPGNNSYLWWTQSSNQMTVVAWDHNLAFGLRPGAGGGTQGNNQRGGSQPPAGQNGHAPGGQTGKQQPNQQGQTTQQNRGPGGKTNPLVNRFNSLTDGTSKVAAEQAKLKQALYTSGAAKKALDAWTSVLASGASSLLDESTRTSEANSIAAYFTK